MPQDILLCFRPFSKAMLPVVAGDLVCGASETYRTGSGRDVALAIYVESGDEDRCDIAMRSLISSMKWDEEVYGLEYDLDSFTIVATQHFNFGAMENKGLNIFNSRAVLADENSATDERMYYIEAVVAHEYFHSGQSCDLSGGFN